MKQLNTGSANRLPVTLSNSGRITRKQKAMAMLGFAFAVLSAGTTKAQTAFTYLNNFEVVVPSGSTANAGGASCADANILATSTSWASTGTFTTFTGTGTGSTATALALDNSAASSQTWTLTIPMSSCRAARMTGLSLDYRSTSTSYNKLIVTVNGTAVYNATITNGTSFNHLTVPAFNVPATAGPIVVAFNMSNATGHTSASGGTFRLDNINLAGVDTAASGSCSGVTAAGTISASGATTFCGTGNANLTLVGANSGCGISYQWQDSSSLTGGAWVNVGTNATTFSASGLTATTYYRATTSCGVASLTSPVVVITVNPRPNPGTINAFSNPVIVGTPVTLGVTGGVGGGQWSTSNTAIATINPTTGVLNPIKGGIITVFYSVTNGVTLCDSSATATVNVAWPNTLALYAGQTGTDVATINVPNDVVSNLNATGFGSASPCTSGGLSGLTVPTTVTSFGGTNPHVGYVVKPAAHKVLNVQKIHAIARESKTGPKTAIIAYRTASNGAGWGAWQTEAVAKAQDTTGSCGSSANSWYFNTGNTNTPDPSINGITDSLEVAVFPYNSGANTGTFQLNSLEVYGIVSDSVACSSLTAAADSVIPAITHICDSGFRFLSYNLGTGGIAGVGVTYQWQVSTTSATSGFSNISGATGATYQTPNMHVGVDAPVSYYRVVVSCAGGGVIDNSVADTVTLAATPANAGVVTGATPAAGSDFPYDHIQIGSSATLTSSTPGANATWSSNDTSSISIDALGNITPHISGDAVITYRASYNGCFASSKDTIISYWPGTEAIYVGRNGNSTNTYAAASFDGASASAISTANWGTGATCSNGGISGLTNFDGSFNSATNGRVSFDLTTSGSFNVTGIHATVRQQNSSTGYKARLVYNTGAGWVSNGTDLDVDQDDCGYSVNDLFFDLSSSPIAIGAAPVSFGVMAFGGVTPQTFQVNSIDVVGDGFGAQRPAVVANVTKADDVMLFPNPATSVLTVAANQAVNVTVLSIDGKKLIDQKNASQINVSGLANGLYMIQVYNTNGGLIKTAKFTKQ